MNENEMELDLDELSSAEDFLDYFEVDYDQHVIHVNRLHILQRWHDYLAQAGTMPADETAARILYRDLLQAAYQDFVLSNAQTEKVFRVFHMNEPKKNYVSLDEIGMQVSGASAL